MHLAFITNLYPPYVVGGNELLCDEVVRALRARGHRVSVLCGRGQELPSGPDLTGALEIDLDRKAETFLGGRLPSAWETVRLHLFSPRSYWATRRWLAEGRPDVVIVWNLYMASLAPLIAARRSGAPVVVHVCDKWLYFELFDLEALLRPVVAWKRAAIRVSRHSLQPLLRRWARPSRLIAISEFMKSVYVRAGFDARSIEVIHLGVPTRDFAVAKRRRRLDGEPLKLLFAGSLWEGKGPQTAVRALGHAAPGGRARPPRRLRRRSPRLRGIPEAGDRGRACRKRRHASRQGGTRRRAALLREPRRPGLPEPVGRALCGRAGGGDELRDGGGGDDCRWHARGDRGR